MKEKYYKYIVSGLLVVATVLWILKLSDLSSEEVIEVNYIGDMESENQSAQYQEQNQESEDLENVLEDRTQIRVLLKDDGYENVTHEVVEVSAEQGLIISGESYTKKISDSESVEIKFEDGMTTIDGEIIEELEQVQIETIEESDKIVIESLERNYGNPEYDGTLDVYIEEETFVIVNEVTLEEYLQGVLPSEMPATYEIEALKAQAVCARTYAYQHMEDYDYPEYEAHVDDSTSYQVYNNLEEADMCNQAIEETQNEMVTYEGSVVTTYFFSTSCGYTTNVEAWGGTVSEENYYLSSVSVSEEGEDYESDLPWYQWQITVSEEELEEVIEVNEGIELGGLQSVTVTERGEGEIALAIEIVGQEISITIENEYSIRCALGSAQYVIELNDGSETTGRSILPSAFFEILNSNGEYIISGGGFGHGIGMSQNGANEMAKLGYSYSEILELFYQGIEILDIK